METKKLIQNIFNIILIVDNLNKYLVWNIFNKIGIVRFKVIFIFFLKKVDNFYLSM